MNNKDGKTLEGRKSESDELSVLPNANRQEQVRVRELTPAGSDPEPAQPLATPLPISERRRQANRRNAQRSTGPRTAAGKTHSRRNAVRHGLLCETVLFGSDHALVDPELQAIYESLRHQYGRDEAEMDALLRSVLVELSHQRRAMELEEICLQNSLDGSSAAVSLDHLHRYRTTSRRALLRHLARLHRVPGRKAS